MDKKNYVLTFLLMLCNLILCLINYYNVIIFFVISLVILASRKVALCLTKKIKIGLIVFILFYSLINIISFLLNRPIRYEYYAFISFVKLFLYTGLLWLYISGVAKKFIPEKINVLNTNLKDKMFQLNSQHHLFFVFMMLVILHSIYFFAFSPGNMYIDSYSQWGQAMGGIKVDDWHPVFSTLLLRISFYITGTPIVFTLLQVLGSIAVFTYASKILLEKKIKPVFVYFFILFIMSSTVTLPSVTTIYKDNLYNIALFFMTLFLFEIVDSKGQWLKNNIWHVVFFTVNAIFLMLCRHNGVYVLIASCILFILFFKGLRIYFTAFLGVVVTIYMLFTGPIFSHYNIEEGSSSEKYSILLQHIGSVIAYDGQIDPEDAEYLNQLLPLDIWKEKYTEEMIDPVKFHASYNREVINENELTFVKVWWNVFKNNPLLALKGHLEQIRPLWDINGWEHGLAGAVMFHFFIDSPKEYYDPYLQEYTFESDDLRSLIEEYSFWKNDYNIETKPFLTTLPALALVCLIISTIILIKEKKFQLLLVVIPVLMNNGTLLLAMPAYNMRYVISTVYIGLFCLFLPFMLDKRKDTILEENNEY
ncbi:DUF6020 family protein [Carnobacterium sp.]|uniref:DUF6020 family protein n=1 Tax=Carnobacterium sp. TaxID=48221 RepID=UPI00388F4872